MFSTLENLHTAEQIARQKEETLVWDTGDKPIGMILRYSSSRLLLWKDCIFSKCFTSLCNGSELSDHRRDTKDVLFPCWGTARWKQLEDPLTASASRVLGDRTDI